MKFKVGDKNPRIKIATFVFSRQHNLSKSSEFPKAHIPAFVNKYPFGKRLAPKRLEDMAVQVNPSLK